VSLKDKQSLKDRITDLESQVKDLKKQLEEFKEFVTNILRQPCNDTYPLLRDEGVSVRDYRLVRKNTLNNPSTSKEKKESIKKNTGKNWY